MKKDHVICFWICAGICIFLGLVTIFSCIGICFDINLSKKGCIFGNYLVVISSVFFAISCLAFVFAFCCDVNMWSKCPGVGAALGGAVPLVMHILAFLFYDRSCIGDQWYYSWWIFLIYVTMLCCLLLCCLAGCFFVLGKGADLEGVFGGTTAEAEKDEEFDDTSSA